MKSKWLAALILSGAVISASPGAFAQDMAAPSTPASDSDPLPAGGAAGNQAPVLADGTLLGIGAAAAAIAIIAVLASGGGGTTTTTGTR